MVLLVDPYEELAAVGAEDAAVVRPVSASSSGGEERRPGRLLEQIPVAAQLLDHRLGHRAERLVGALELFVERAERLDEQLLDLGPVLRAGVGGQREPHHRAAGPCPRRLHLLVDGRLRDAERPEVGGVHVAHVVLLGSEAVPALDDFVVKLLLQVERLDAVVDDADSDVRQHHARLHRLVEREAAPGLEVFEPVLHLGRQVFFDQALVFVRPLRVAAVVLQDAWFCGGFLGFLRDYVFDAELFFEGLNFRLSLRVLRVVLSDQLEHADALLGRALDRLLLPA